MNLSKILQNKISTPVALGTVILVAILAGGILVWQGWLIIEAPPIEIFPKPESQVTITIDKTEYEQGETVKINIKNGSNNTKWIHYPFWIVENFDEGGWKKINRILCPCGVSCRMPSYWELESNKTIKDEWDQKEMWCKEGMPSISEATVSQQVEPGKYRLKLLVSDAKQDAPQKIIYSNEFTIKERKAEQVVLNSGCLGDIVDWLGLWDESETKNECFKILNSRHDDLENLGYEPKDCHFVEARAVSCSDGMLGSQLQCIYSCKKEH